MKMKMENECGCVWNYTTSPPISTYCVLHDPSSAWYEVLGCGGHWVSDSEKKQNRRYIGGYSERQLVRLYQIMGGKLPEGVAL